jgi:3-oxoacyl-[acyl-carrier protein] reductase
MSKEKKRVAIIADTKMHMGPWVARELAQKNHDLVIADPAEGLAEELRGLGAKVEVVEGAEDLNDQNSVKKMVDRAMDVFGHFDAACIRSGHHGVSDIFHITQEDMDGQVAGNMMSVVYALQVLLPPLVEQKSGQIVINTSAGGDKPVPACASYCATRAGANMLIRCAAYTVAEHGVCVNATGTNYMNYPSYLHDMGADKDPSVIERIAATIPLRRLGEPKEAAHFVASLLDGENSYQTGNFFPIDGGNANSC